MNDNIIRKETEDSVSQTVEKLINTEKEIGQSFNEQKTKWLIIFQREYVHDSMVTGNWTFERVSNLKFLEADNNQQVNSYK